MIKIIKDIFNSYSISMKSLNSNTIKTDNKSK